MTTFISDMPTFISGMPTTTASTLPKAGLIALGIFGGILVIAVAAGVYCLLR